MARFFPMSETYVTGRKQLIGAVGKTVSTKLTSDYGRVTVRDPHGNDLTLHCRMICGFPPVKRGDDVFVAGYDAHEKKYLVRPVADESAEKEHLPPADTI